MMASPISSSGSSSPNPSIMTTAFSVLATIRSRSLFSSSSAVGNATSWPSTRPEPDRADGAVEGHPGQHQGGRGADHRQHVRIIGAVGGDRARLDLHLVAIRIGEQRPDRPVDQPRRQDLLGGRPALALDEAAGELARGIGLLAVIDGQGEEIEALPAGRGDDGDQRHRVADSHDHGTAGLLGEMTGLDAQELAADGSLDKLAWISRCWTWTLPGGNGARRAPARRGRVDGLGWSGRRRSDRTDDSPAFDPSTPMPRPQNGFPWRSPDPIDRANRGSRPEMPVERAGTGQDRGLTNESKSGEPRLEPGIRDADRLPDRRTDGRDDRRWHGIARDAAAGQNPPAGRHLRIPRRLITSRYFFRSWSRRYFSKLDRLETIISSPRRLAWSLACVLK